MSSFYYPVGRVVKGHETSNMQQVVTTDPTQQGYRKLIVWQKADDLAFHVYSITKNYPKDEMFGLISQMRRAAVSVAANIVEGYSRSTPKDKRQFYVIARGSLSEPEYYLDFSLRLSYISIDEHTKLVTLRETVGRLLNGFMKNV